MCAAVGGLCVSWWAKVRCGGAACAWIAGQSAQMWGGSFGKNGVKSGENRRKGALRWGGLCVGWRAKVRCGGAACAWVGGRRCAAVGGFVRGLVGEGALQREGLCVGCRVKVRYSGRVCAWIAG